MDFKFYNALLSSTCSSISLERSVPLSPFTGSPLHVPRSSQSRLCVPPTPSSWHTSPPLVPRRPLQHTHTLGLNISQRQKGQIHNLLRYQVLSSLYTEKQEQFWKQSKAVFSTLGCVQSLYSWDVSKTDTSKLPRLTQSAKLTRILQYVADEWPLPAKHTHRGVISHRFTYSLPPRKQVRTQVNMIKGKTWNLL